MMTNSLNVETFVEYAIGMSFLLLRMIARLNFGGLSGLRLDDAFAVAGIIFWTLQTVNIYLLEMYGNNIGLTAVTALEVPDRQMPKMILGSKLAFMNWIWYISYLWSLKGVLLCLYWKLTQGTRTQKLVLAAVGFCIVSWLACILTHICVCTPITHNWQIKPYAGDNCTLRPPLYVVVAVLNVMSDVMIMVIPILMLGKLQVAFQRKIILALMFTSGVFIMICTVLRCYYSLGDISNLPLALRWADRESFVAAIVVSLPGIKPLFRGVGWLGFSSYAGTKNVYSTEGYNKFASRGNRSGGVSFAERSGNRKSLELSTMPGLTQKRSSSEESERPILHGGGGKSFATVGPGNSTQQHDKFSIQVTTELRLQEEQGERRDLAHDMARSM
ncbi:uncharacterized protein N7484_000559 [Penicillium longicatenatum]|uniref:uncharacterized protein n=1 Tax=Penicillium longicatenatum TaxID=1561947 RepID=UPI002546C14C|nr:uncharacterized protein N7484_000559 [Penicillium longicatenatum]KAJ5661187.1 hypothetical protein N7484_000559 [Penicillium longicatenatum]